MGRTLFLTSKEINHGNSYCAGHDSSNVLAVPCSTEVGVDWLRTPGKPQRVYGGSAGFLRMNRNSTGPEHREKGI